MEKPPFISQELYDIAARCDYNAHDPFKVLCSVILYVANTILIKLANEAKKQGY